MKRSGMWGESAPHQKSFGDAIVSLLSGIAHEDLRVASQYPPVVKNPPLDPAGGRTSETLARPEEWCGQKLRTSVRSK